MARTAICVVDLTSIDDGGVADIKAVVARAGGVAAENIIVVAGHSFSAPHMFSADHMPPDMARSGNGARRMTAYHDAVLAAVNRAAANAAASIRPAMISLATGLADVNVNRNVPMADGWWLGANDAGPSDKELGVVRIDDAARRPIALLLNYAVQSSVMDHSIGAAGAKVVTSDLGGAAVAFVENQYANGAVSLFLTGAAGDQQPGYTARVNQYDRQGKVTTADIGDQGFTLLAAQGNRLGEAAVRVAERAQPATTPGTLRVLRGSVELASLPPRPRGQETKPSRTYRFVAAGTAKAPFVVMVLGDTALVGVQVELSARTGQYIRQHSPFAHTVVVTMTDGAAKYMPDAAGYRDITYEAMGSFFAPGAAEKFADAILTTLRAASPPKSR